MILQLLCNDYAKARKKCRDVTFHLDKSNPWQTNPPWHSTDINKIPAKLTRLDGHKILVLFICLRIIEKPKLFLSINKIFPVF